MQKSSPSFKPARKWHDYINFSFADQNAAAKKLSFLFKMMKIRVDDDTLSVMINMKRKKQSKKI